MEEDNGGVIRFAVNFGDVERGVVTGDLRSHASYTPLVSSLPSFSPLLGLFDVINKEFYH